MTLTKGKAQVEVEIYANIETQKVVTWARDNKIIFHDQESKLVLLTRRKPKMKGTLKFISITKYHNKKTQ